jgi:hypothetical protein
MKVLLQYVFDADCEECDAESVDCIYLDTITERTSSTGGDTMCVCLECLKKAGEGGKGLEVPIEDPLPLVAHNELHATIPPLNPIRPQHLASFPHPGCDSLLIKLYEQIDGTVWDENGDSEYSVEDLRRIARDLRRDGGETNDDYAETIEDYLRRHEEQSDSPEA